mmetsp:Transcript_12595/g.45967  ORF Transcript_12595/g.45967 Transcript_12595/m.45967 type:complete len:147 (+) Transcript_12595:854-1294(+)
MQATAWNALSWTEVCLHPRRRGTGSPDGSLTASVAPTTMPVTGPPVSGRAVEDRFVHIVSGPYLIHDNETKAAAHKEHSKYYCEGGANEPPLRGLLFAIVQVHAYSCTDEKLRHDTEADCRISPNGWGLTQDTGDHCACANADVND